MTQRFQVDLAGMVDLLSGNLYSGPHVYLRELLQNAVDAVAARSAANPAAPGVIRLRNWEDDGVAALDVTDTGIGLSAQEAVALLATIGRSSKRDAELGGGRSEFIGQFGIGLLAAFMVADRVDVISRSARPGTAPIHWTGRADGTFELEELDGAGPPIGTTMRLRARRGAEHWLSRETVLDLARDYGSLLDADVQVQVGVEGRAPMWRRISEPELPWARAHPSPAARQHALTTYCERTFGFTPLSLIDLALPAAGLTGVAFVLPQAVSPGSGRHRVYLKRMLLGPRVDAVMPDWAFFTRAVINAEVLSPTASREEVRDDATLAAVREGLADQLQKWALDVLSEPSPFAEAFIATHHLALRALALTDPQILDLVAEVLPYETTDGPMTLAEVARRAPGGRLLYATTTQAYRRVATVARAQGLIVVNAGYVYDADLLERLARRPGWQLRELSNDDLVQVLSPVGLERELEVSDAVARGRRLLADDDCDVVVRRFSPPSVPAVLLRDEAGERRRDLDRERRAAPGRWAGILDDFADDAGHRSRTLVLNDDSAVARRLSDHPRAQVFDAGLRSLYYSAVMLAGDGLRSDESAGLGRAIGGLLEACLDGAAPTTGPAGGPPPPGGSTDDPKPPEDRS